MAGATTHAAQVVLVTPGAKPAQVTAENVRSIIPPPEAFERARRAFEALGFHAGPGVGTSFSIEGDKLTFQEVFGRHVNLTAGNLPLDGLPASLRSQVQAIVFSKPPAFGPGAP